MQLYYSVWHLEQPKESNGSATEIESTLKMRRRKFLDSIEDTTRPLRSILEQKRDDFVTYFTQAKELTAKAFLFAAAEIDNLAQQHLDSTTEKVSKTVEDVMNLRRRDLEKLFLQTASRSGPLRRLFEDIESVITMQIKQIEQEFVTSAELALQDLAKDSVENGLSWKISIGEALKKATADIEHTYESAATQLRPGILDRAFWEDLLYYAYRTKDRLKNEMTMQLRKRLKEFIGCNC